MARLLACTLFAAAAGASVLASMGVAAPPHRMPPGTPLFHTLVLRAYGYGFLIDPARETRPMSPEMAALHKVLALAGIPMTDMPGMEDLEGAEQGPIFAASGLTPMQDLAIHFALLAFLVPLLPRPTRRPIAVLRAPVLRAPQWWPALPGAPPRPFALSSTAA